MRESVTNVQALAVQLRGQTREDVSDLAGDKLLMCCRGLVVGAVRDGCFNTEGATHARKSRSEPALVEE